MATTKVTDTFYDITGVRIPPTSQLNTFDILQDDDGEQFMNIFKSFTLSEDILDSSVFYDVFQVDQANTWWELISYRFYNTPKLWWVVCIMNDVTNPFEDIESGDYLKILKEGYVYQLLRETQSLAEL